MDQIELPFDTRHLGVPLGAPKMIFMPMEHSAQSMHLSFIEINSLQMDRNELSLDPCHVGVPSGASKIISEHMVRLAQTMHISCVQINTISKRTHIIHQVRPRRFHCMWYIRHKPCTYLLPRLTLSPNGPK
jgi:hypothetical protein